MAEPPTASYVWFFIHLSARFTPLQVQELTVLYELHSDRCNSRASASIRSIAFLSEAELFYCEADRPASPLPAAELFAELAAALVGDGGPDGVSAELRQFMLTTFAFLQSVPSTESVEHLVTSALGVPPLPAHETPWVARPVTMQPEQMSNKAPEPLTDDAHSEMDLSQRTHERRAYSWEDRPVGPSLHDAVHGSSPAAGSHGGPGGGRGGRGGRLGGGHDRFEMSATATECVERGEFVVEVLAADDDRRRQRQPLTPLSASQLAGALTEETRSSIGRWGEEFVCRYLEDSVPAGQRVVWLNRLAESGECYDLVVEDVATAEVLAYVEVKTSKAAEKMLFEVSHHEWTFAQMRGDSFHFYRCVASWGVVGRALRRQPAELNWKTLWLHTGSASSPSPLATSF
jgi:hypothetical protein